MECVLIVKRIPTVGKRDYQLFCVFIFIPCVFLLFFGGVMLHMCFVPSSDPFYFIISHYVLHFSLQI